VSSLVFDGAARIWSDFTIKDNGGGRILLEIGNYRKLALLGFPLARELMPWLTDLEARHNAISERRNSAAASSSEMLAELFALSAQIELKAGEARFRLGATNSYHLLTTDRLRSLRETAGLPDRNHNKSPTKVLPDHRAQIYETASNLFICTNTSLWI
jgi:uncharacterized membrane-anchored protein